MADVHDDPRWTVVAASAMVTVLESRPMRTMHHDTYAQPLVSAPKPPPGASLLAHPTGTLAKQPVVRLPPALPPRTEKQLTAPADRPVRAPAHAVAFSTAVAAGYHRNVPGSPPPSSPSQTRAPALPVNDIRCSADHHPAWRCVAGADVRRADGACMMGRARAARSAPHNTASTQTKPYSASIAETYGKWRCKMILKEPHTRAA